MGPWSLEGPAIGRKFQTGRGCDRIHSPPRLRQRASLPKRARYPTKRSAIVHAPVAVHTPARSEDQAHQGLHGRKAGVAGDQALRARFRSPAHPSRRPCQEYPQLCRPRAHPGPHKFESSASAARALRIQSGKGSVGMHSPPQRRIRASPQAARDSDLPSDAIVAKFNAYAPFRSRSSLYIRRRGSARRRRQTAHRPLHARRPHERERRPLLRSKAAGSVSLCAHSVESPQLTEMPARSVRHMLPLILEPVVL